MDRDQVQAIREALQRREHRLTPQREAVLRVLLENQDQHLSAEEVYRATKDRHPEIGLATVYRTLELFEKLGFVRRLDSGEGHMRFEFNPTGEHYHHHVICLQCGRIQEFNQDLLEALEERIARELDFEIVDHNLRFFGYCKECRAGRSRRPSPNPFTLP